MKMNTFPNALVRFVQKNLRVSALGISVAIFGLSAFIATAPVSAETAVTTAAPQQAESAPATPQIYATNLVLKERNFRAGDVVSGSFTLSNGSSVNAPEVNYQIELVGNYKNGLAKLVYDVVKRPSIYLAAGENQVINFTYQLPKNIAGDDLGIYVQAYFGKNQPMGWTDARISVAGVASVVSITKVGLKIDGKYYLPESGPSVPKGGQIDYEITFQNPTKSIVTFTPNIKIYDRSVLGSILKDYKEVAVSVDPGKQKTVTFSLPTFDYAPKIYAGEVQFLDSNGQFVAPRMSFRYMILGDIGTIQTATSDVVSVSAGGTVNVTVFYTGAPFDQFTGVHPTVGTATMTAVLYDPNNVQIGTAKADVDLDAPNRQVVIPVNVSAAAQSLKLKVTLTKGSNTLSTYGVDLSPSLPVANNIPGKQDFGSTIAYVVGLIVILFVIIGVVMIIAKKGKKNIPPPPTSSSTPPASGTGGGMPMSGMPGSSAGGFARVSVALLLALALIGAALWQNGLSAQKVRAYTQTSSTTTLTHTLWLLPTLFINRNHSDVGATYDYKVLPGSTFFITGSSSYNECTNQIAATNTITAAPYNFSGVSKSMVIDNTSEVQNNFTAEDAPDYSIANNFVVGPFTAPMTTGNYKIHISDKVESVYYSNNYLNTAVVEGDIPILVQGSPLVPPPTLTTSTPGPSGGSGGTCSGSVKLQWTSVPGATGYDLYRDNDATPFHQSGAGETMYYDNGVAPLSTHDYFVIATSPNGNSAASNKSSQKASGCLDLSVVCGSSLSTTGVGGQITWTSYVSGGLAPYTYSWSGTDGLSGSGPSVNKTYNTTGPKNASVTVTSASPDSQSKTVSCTGTVVVKSAVVGPVTCAASPQNAFIGEPITWTATPDNPGDYAYSWSGDDNLTGSSQSITKIYSTVGNKTARVDILGQGISPDCSANILIKVKPNVVEF